MALLGGRKKRDESEKITHGHLEGITDPETCKVMKGHWDKKDRKCHAQYEKKSDRPKEIKFIEYDEYISPSDEGGEKALE